MRGYSVPKTYFYEQKLKPWTLEDICFFGILNDRAYSFAKTHLKCFKFVDRVTKWLCDTNFSPLSFYLFPISFFVEARYFVLTTSLLNFLYPKSRRVLVYPLSALFQRTFVVYLVLLLRPKGFLLGSLLQLNLELAELKFQAFTLILTK